MQSIPHNARRANHFATEQPCGIRSVPNRASALTDILPPAPKMSHTASTAEPRFMWTLRRMNLFALSSACLLVINGKVSHLGYDGT